MHKTIHEIRIVGGHPALDLVNTVDARRDRWGPDALRDFADLAYWAGRASVLPETEVAGALAWAQDHPAEAEAAWQRAVAARELLYGVFLAEAQGRTPDPAEADRLAHLVQDATGYRDLVVLDQGFAWRWHERDGDTILHRVVFAAAELLVDRARRRVRECTGRNCGWLFLDQSKGGRRRWCSEAGCGTRERVRRVRSKSAASEKV